MEKNGRSFLTFVLSVKLGCGIFRANMIWIRVGDTQRFKDSAETIMKAKVWNHFSRELRKIGPRIHASILKETETKLLKAKLKP